MSIEYARFDPRGVNIVYIAASTAVDGRGKIFVGQQAIEQFDAFHSKAFLVTRWHIL